MPCDSFNKYHDDTMISLPVGLYECALYICEHIHHGAKYHDDTMISLPVGLYECTLYICEHIHHDAKYHDDTMISLPVGLYECNLYICEHVQHEADPVVHLWMRGEFMDCMSGLITEK